MSWQKALGTTILSLVALSAQAQPSTGWVQLDKRPERVIKESFSDGGTTTVKTTVDLYYLPKIKKNNDLATVSILSHPGMPENGSVTLDIEFDCKKNTFKIVKATGFEAKMAQGKSQTDDSLGKEPAVSATDLLFFQSTPNDWARMMYSLTTARFGSLKGVACDGKTPADYKNAVDAVEAQENALAEAAAAEQRKLTLCGDGATCKSLNRLATTSPLADAKWLKIESTPERGDLFYDANIVTAKDVEIKVQKAFFSFDEISKKTSIGMSRLLINLPPTAAATSGKLLVQDSDDTDPFNPKKLEPPLVAKSLVLNVEFDCPANILRLSNSAAYTEQGAQGKLVVPPGFRRSISSTAETFEPVNDNDGKPRAAFELGSGAVDEKGVQTSLTYLKYTPPSLLQTLCSPAPAAGMTPIVAAPAAATTPVNSAPKSIITSILTPAGEFQPARGFGGQYWSFGTSEGGIYLKEIENNDKNIVLEGYGLRFAIDPTALRLTYTVGTSRKAVNIDEAKSSVELHSYAQIMYDGGQLSFHEDPESGPMNVWVLKANDGSTSQLVDMGASDLFFDPVKNIQIGVDLSNKTMTFDVKSKKPIVKKIIKVNATHTEAKPAAPTKPAATNTGAKPTNITEVVTSLAGFYKSRGFGGKYWLYLPLHGDGWASLREIENSDKAIVLEGYGLQFSLDPVSLRMTYSVDGARKGINIEEAKSEANLHSFTTLQFSDGQLDFKEDLNGPLDSFEVKLKTGETYLLVDQGWGSFYDPVRNTQVAIDLDEKKITFDANGEKPVVKKILSLK